MFWNSRRNLVEEALTDWEARGLLPSETANALRTDLGPAKPRDFSRTVIWAGTICLGLAVLTFVGANWSEMPRALRLLLVLALLWSGWGLAWFWRAQNTRVEAAILFATVAFGAAIALVSQIFHIQGDWQDAVFLWAIGALAGSLLSGGLWALALSALLLPVWDIARFDRSAFSPTELIYLALLSLAALGAFRARHRLSAHILTFAALAWIAGTLGRLDMPPWAVFFATPALIALSGLALYSALGPRHLKGFETALLGWLLCAAIATLLLLFLGADEWQRDFRTAPLSALAALPPLTLSAALTLPKGPALYDRRICALLTGLALPALALPLGPWPFAALALGLSLWSLRMGWRHSLPALPSLGLAGFFLTLFTLYFETLGSLIGTAGFYFGAGLLLIGGAWAFGRLKRGTQE
jgi:uncharacterized membrane protein